MPPILNVLMSKFLRRLLQHVPALQTHKRCRQQTSHYLPIHTVSHQKLEFVSTLLWATQTPQQAFQLQWSTYCIFNKICVYNNNNNNFLCSVMSLILQKDVYLMQITINTDVRYKIIPPHTICGCLTGVNLSNCQVQPRWADTPLI